MPTADLELTQLLSAHWQRRRDQNPAYSMRAFARDLGISVSSVSRILAGVTTCSPPLRRKIAERLKLDPVASQRVAAPASAPFQEVDASAEMQRFVREWWHSAIASMTTVPGFRFEAGWIGGRLGIGVDAAADAMARLLRLGFIRETEPGVFVCQDVAITSSALARPAFEPDANLLAKARLLQAAVLQTDPAYLQVSDISSMTFAANAERVAGAKKRIQSFRRSLARSLDRTPSSDVYLLVVGLFPIPPGGMRDLEKKSP